MKIIGLMGAIGCGKGTVADILKNDFGYSAVTTGEIVREEVTKRGLKITRQISTEVSEDMRKKDPEALIKIAIKKIKESSWDKAIVDGIRLPIDIKALKKAFPEMIFVLVKCDPKARYERMISRKREDAPKTYQDFLKQEKIEIDKFNLEETWKAASIFLSNDGTMDDLKTQVVEMLEDLGWI